MAGPVFMPITPVYCTDEDIAIRSYGAFGQLVPTSNTLAYGTDGVISAGNLWTLTSATVDFEAQGIRVGHVILLTKPATTFRGAGRYFGVGSVAGNSVTLRICGKLDGIGQPPAPVGGLTGVEFRCSTFDPEIESTSYEINQEFGLRSTDPDNIADLRVLNQATVLTVLHRAYVFAPITVAQEYAQRLSEVSVAKESAIDQVTIRWGSQGSAETQSSTVLFGRIERA
jgi:hypothetical protein